MAVQLSTKASDDKPISFEQLPATSRQIIKNYFPDQSIALVKKDLDFFEKSYEVIFTNGDKIEFDRKGNWKEVDCKHTQLPDKLIPEQIKNYVSKNYTEIKIIKIEKENRNRYDVELSNGVELKFDSNYKLIDIDN